MNREAAALHVPVYSIFRGKIGAVDRYLAKNGRLVLLENVEDVRAKIVLARRSRPAALQNTKSPTLHNIVEAIVTIVESKGRQAMRDDKKLRQLCTAGSADISGSR